MAVNNTGITQGWVPVSELLQDLDKAQVGFTNGNYYQFDTTETSGNRTLAGRTQAEVDELNKYAKKAQEKGLTVNKLFSQLEATAHNHGLQLVAGPSGRGDNTYTIMYVPLNSYDEHIKQLNRGAKSANELIDLLPHFTFGGIDAHGLVSKNGQGTINQGMLDIESGEIVYYTAVEKLLREQLEKFSLGPHGENASFLRNVSTATDMSVAEKYRKQALKSVRNSVAYTTKKVENGNVAAQTWQRLTQEYKDALQGTGSKRSLDIRKGYMNVKPLIDSLLDEDWATVSAYKKANYGKANTTSKASREAVSRDLMQVLALYSQTANVEDVEEEINAFGNGKLKYLKGSNSIKFMRELGRSLNRAHPDIGLSQEGSLDNFLISLVGNPDISIIGDLDDKSSKKRLQVANSLRRMQKARKVLTDTPTYFTKKRLFTKHESLNQLMGDDSDFEYLNAFASEEEVRKAGLAVYDEVYKEIEDAYRKAHKITDEAQLDNASKAKIKRLAESRAGLVHGAHSGGLYYSSDVASSFDSEQVRSATFSQREFNTTYKKILNKFNEDRQSGALAQNSVFQGNINAELKEALESGAALTPEEEAQLTKAIEYAAARQLVLDKLRKSNPTLNKNDIDLDNISDVLYYGGGEHRIVNYTQARKHKEGMKLLGDSDYTIKGVGTELSQLVLDRILENRREKDLERLKSGKITQEEFDNLNNLDKGRKVSILRAPEKFDIRTMPGILEGYIRAVFGSMSQEDINNALNNEENKFLKQWFTQTTGKEEWVLNKKIFDRATDSSVSEKELAERLGNFVNALNKIKTNIYKDVFKVDASGNITIDYSAYRGSTGVSQFAGYEYGGPGKNNLNIDYRAKGAIDRALSMAAYSTGTDMGILSQYLLGDNTQHTQEDKQWVPNIVTDKKGNQKFSHAGLYNGSKKDQENYISWMNKRDEILKNEKWSLDRTKEYGLKDILANDDVVMQYGSFENFLAANGIKSDADLEKWIIDSEGDLELRRKFSARNQEIQKWNTSPHLLGLSTASEAAKKQELSFEQFIQQYTQEIRNKLASQYFDLSNFAGDVNSLKYDDGHVTKASWDESFRAIDTLQGSHKGRTLFLPSTNAFYGESGDRAVGGNYIAIPTLKDYDSVVEMYDENGERVEDMYDVPSVLQGFQTLISTERNLAGLKWQIENGKAGEDAQESLEYLTRQVSEDSIELLASINREVNSKNGTVYQRANKVGIGHSMFGSAISNLSTIGLDQYSDVDADFQQRLNESGVIISAEDATPLLKRDDNEGLHAYLKALEANYHYIYDETAAYQDVQSSIENLLKGAKDDAGKIKILTQELIKANTIGSEEFKERLAATKANGGVFRGLSGNLFRFPLSNGFDAQSTEVFFDSALDQGAMQAGLGIGRGINLDFDGDKIVFNLDLTNDQLSKFSDEKLQQLLQSKKAVTDVQGRINSAIAMTTAESMVIPSEAAARDQDGNIKSGKIYVDDAGHIRSNLNNDEIQQIFNRQAQETSAVLSRLNKKYTGSLSNNYQAITEALASIHGHSDNTLKDNDVVKNEVVSDMIVRGVFEGFTQDAISSKKVIDRITKQYKSKGVMNWADSADFYSDLDQLQALFKQKGTYDSKESLHTAMKKAVDMGIFGENDALSDRITARIIATAQQLFADENGNLSTDESIDKFANALHITKEQAEQLRYQYDDKGHVLKTGYKPKDFGLSLDTVENVLLDANRELHYQTGYDFAGAQWNKAKIIPGGMDAASNPIYRLGDKLFDQAELDHLKLVNPALAELIEKYGTLKDAAEDTAKAINAEAAAEQNKTAVAGVEGKAIKSSTEAYKERMRVLKDLDKIKNDASDISVSKDLDKTFSNPYNDTTGFTDMVTRKYAEMQASGADLSKGVTAEAMGWTSESSQREFTNYMKGYWAPVEGKIADSVEQILTKTRQDIIAAVGEEAYKQDYADKLSNYDELKKFITEHQNDKNGIGEVARAAQLDLISGVKGAEGVEFLLGTADYSQYKATDLLTPDNNSAYFVDGKTYTDIDEAYQALQDAAAKNAQMLQATYGDRAGLYQNHYLRLGQGLSNTILRMTSGDMSRVGSGEQELIYSPDGTSWRHGRADRLLYDTRKAGDTDIFGNIATKDQDVITVFDKKIIGDKEHINPRYVAQVMEYILMLQQIEDEIKKYNDTTAGKAAPITAGEAGLQSFLNNTALGKKYLAKYGENAIDQTLFDKLANGAAINGGLLTMTQSGHAGVRNIGFNSINGSFQLTGNRDVDAQITQYLKDNIQYEDWDEGVKRAYMESVKMNPLGTADEEDPLTRRASALETLNKLYKEQFEIRKRIHDLELQQTEARDKGQGATADELANLIAFEKSKLDDSKIAQQREIIQDIDRDNGVVNDTELTDLEEQQKERNAVIEAHGVGKQKEQSYDALERQLKEYEAGIVATYKAQVEAGTNAADVNIDEDIEKNIKSMEETINQWAASLGQLAQNDLEEYLKELEGQLRGDESKSESEIQAELDRMRAVRQVSINNRYGEIDESTGKHVRIKAGEFLDEESTSDKSLYGQLTAAEKKRDADSFKKAREDYKTNREMKSALLADKDTLERHLNDTKNPISDEVREEYQTRWKYVDDKLKIVESNLTTITNELYDSATQTYNDPEFERVQKQVDLKYGNIDSRTKSTARSKYERKRSSEKRQIYTQAYEQYKAVHQQERYIATLNEKIKLADSTEEEWLNTELTNAQQLLTEAKNAVAEMEQDAKGHGDARDKYVQSILDQARMHADQEAGMDKAQRARTATPEEQLTDEYVSLRKKKTDLLKKKGFYEQALNDTERPLDDETRETYQEFVKAIDEELTDIIDKRMATILKKFNAQVDADGKIATSDNDKFTEEANRVGRRQQAQEDLDSMHSQESYERKMRASDKKVYTEAYRYYNDVNKYKLEMMKTNDALARETDSDKIAALQAKQETLSMLGQTAQDDLNEYLEQFHGHGSGGQDSANDLRQQDIVARAERQSNLEHIVKAADAKKANPNEFDATSLSDQLTNYLGQGLRRLLQGGAITKMISTIRKTIQRLTQEASAMDGVFTNLQITTGGTREQTYQLMSEYSQLGRSLGVTTKEVAQSALEWQRQGYDSAEVTDLVTSSMYLSKLGMLDATTATKDLTSSLKGFKLEASESMDVVDKLTAIDMKAATSAGEIAEGLSQFANLGSLSGVSIDEAAAYVATISDVTQMTGSSAGQALKTIISRYGNVKASAYDELSLESDSSGGETVNDVERVLKKLGISIRDSNLSFKSFDTVLNEIAEKWAGLDTVSKKAVSTAFAGVRQQEAFTTLMQNWDKYQELLDVSRNSSGTASEKYDAYQESLQASKNALETTWESATNSAQVSEALIGINKALTFLSKALPTLIEYIPQAIVALEQIKIFKGGSTLMRLAYKMGGSNIAQNIKQGGVKYAAGQLLFGGRKRWNKWTATQGRENVFNDSAETDDARHLRPIRRVSAQRFRRSDSSGQWEAVSSTGAPTSGVSQMMRINSASMSLRSATMSASQVVINSANTTNNNKGSSGKSSNQGTPSGTQTVGSAPATTSGVPYAITMPLNGNNTSGSTSVIMNTTQGTAVIPLSGPVGSSVSQAQLPGPTIGSVPALPGPAPNWTRVGGPSVSNGGVIRLGGPVATASMDGANGWQMVDSNVGNSGQYAIVPYSNTTTAITTTGNGGSIVPVTTGGGALVPVGQTPASGTTAPKTSTYGNLAAVSYAVGQTAAAISAYQSSGKTHTYTNSEGEEETVTSSERAHKTGRAISTSLSLAIPGLGYLLGDIIGDKIMSAIDKERDMATEITELAQEALNTLNSISEDIDQLDTLRGSLSTSDATARENAANNILSELYKSENTETRQLLNQYLSDIYGEQISVQDVLEKYQSRDEKTQAQAIKALELAQLQATHQKEREARSEELYNYKENVNEQLLKYNAAQKGYNSKGITYGQEADAVHTGIDTGLLGAGAVAATGGAIAGLIGGASGAGLAATIAAGLSGPVGWIILAVAAVGGIVAGIAATQAEEEKYQEEQAKKWDKMTINEQVQYMSDRQQALQENINSIDAQITEANDTIASGNTAEAKAAEKTLDKLNDQLDTATDQLEITSETLSVLQDYRDYLENNINAENKAVLEEGLLKAGTVWKTGENAGSTTRASEMDTYLTDMNRSQLKNLDKQGIYEMLAASIDPGDLIDMNIYRTDADGNIELDADGNKVFSEQFIDMATSVLGTDEEISSVLSGEAYTLSEAYAKFGNKADRFSKETMQSFADALGVTTDQVVNYIDTLGTLSLSDLLKSTSELIESIGTYSSLLDSVVDSTQSSSQWMSKVVTQFPDLISYMSDTPTLISKVTEKIVQLNNQIINSQFGEYSASTDYFEDTINPDITSYVTDQYGASKAEDIQKLITDQNITTMDDLNKYLAGVDASDPNAADAQILKEAYRHAGSETVMVADGDNEQLQDFIEYITSLMQKEVDALNEQKSAMQDINQQREYELKLLQAKLDLQDALNNKQRVYRAGVGFVYEADQGAIKKAKDNLEEVQREKDISAITKQIEIMQGTLDEWSNIWNIQTEEQKATAANEYAEQRLGWENGIADVTDGIFGTNTMISTSGGEIGNGLGALSGDVTNLNGDFTESNKTLNSTLSTGYSNVVGATNGVQETVENKVDEVLDEMDKDREEKMNDVTQAYSAWRSAVNSGNADTGTLNDLLADYREAFQTAQQAGYITNNSYGGWTKAEGTGNEANTFGSEYSYRIGTGTSTYHNDYEWVLPNSNDNCIYTYKASGLSELSDSDTVAENLMEDIGKRGGKSAWYWTKDNYQSGGARLSSNSYLTKKATDSNLSDYVERISNNGYDDIIIRGKNEDNAAWIHNGKAYKIYADTDSEYYDTGGDISETKKYAVWHQAVTNGNLATYASGTLSSRSGLSRINEYGTEAIITPQGTITALPSSSGVVPADITKNLWSLGEVAPNLLRVMESIDYNLPAFTTASTQSTDESVNIASLTMNVSADSSFDADAFVSAIRTRVDLTKNNRK